MRTLFTYYTINIMIFKKAVVVLLVLCMNVVYAQNTVNLSGSAVGASDNESLIFASVGLYNNVTKEYVKGLQSDDEGKFTFEGVSKGVYFLKITYVGYQDYLQEGIVVDGSKNVDLGVLKVKSVGNQLDEVVVTGATPAMQMAIDKKVFNVGQSTISVGGTATDLLANVPSLQVDMDGSVSLRGSSSVRILIDGKESAMAGNDITRLLQALPANSIDRIEVITNPSAKYDAEGQSGIINIILKRDSRYGFNGAVNLSAGSYENLMSGLNLNYRHGKVNYFGNYSFSRRNNVGDNKSNTRILSDNSVTDLTGENTRLGLNHGVGFGVDYYAGQRTTLGISSNMSFRDNDRREDLYYKYFNNPAFAGDSRRFSRQNEKDFGFDVNFNFKQEFVRKGEELTANLAFGKDKEDGVNTFEQFYVSSNNTIENRRNETAEKGRNTNIQVDYLRPLNESSKFGTGYRSIIRTSDENQFSFLKEEAGFVPDYTISNDFEMKSQVHAVYGSYENQLTRSFGFQVGLRAEQAYLDTEYTSYPDLKKSQGRLDYFRLYPSVFVSQKMGENNQFQGSYTRRVNRPRGWQVNPFVNVSDPMNIRQGNPNLMPEDIHSFELGYVRYWGKNTFTTTGYYRLMKDVVQNVTSTADASTGVTFSQWQNISKNEASGLELISQLFFGKKVDVMANANFFYNKFYAEPQYEIKGSSGFNWNVNATTNYRIIPNLSAQLRTEYQAPRILAQGKSVSQYILDAGIKLDVLKKKGSVMFNARDLLNQRRWGGYTETAQFYRTHENRWMRRMFMVSFSYRFGKAPETKDNKKNQRQEFDGGGEGF